MRLARAIRIVAVVALASLIPAAMVLGPACLDVTPITVPPRDAGGFTQVDGGCTTCLETPHEQHGCRDVLDGCRADPGCAPVLACVEWFACLDGPTIDDKVNCSVPCITEAGITAVDDPRVQRILSVIKCGQKQCPVCNFGDSGSFGLDGF